MEYLQHDYMLTWTALNHLFNVYVVINEVVVLIKTVEKNEMLYFNNDVTENQYSVKVLTQKSICGTVLTVQFLPSGKHKTYDHVLTSNSANTKHISG